MRTRLLLALAALTAGISSPTAAADVKRNTPEDLRMLRDFSGCVAKEMGGQTRRVLKLDYRTEAYRRSLRNLATELRPCRPFSAGALRMSSVLLAGGLAEALLPKALGGATLASRTALDPSLPAIPARDEGEYLGLCAARSMPDRVSALLATDPASAEEQAAVAAISGNLGPCFRAGASARLNRPGLRALLALGAYRIVTQTRPGPGGN